MLPHFDNCFYNRIFSEITGNTLIGVEINNNENINKSINIFPYPTCC